MHRLAYIFVIIGVAIGGWELLNTLAFAESAPQQAAGAAMALAWAVLPYCFARAVEKLGESSLDDVLGKYFTRQPIDSGPPLPAGTVYFDLPPKASPPQPAAPQKPAPAPTQRRANPSRNIFTR